MAITYNSNIGKCFTYQLTNGLLSTSGVTGYTCITVYGGVRPSASTVANNWSTYNSVGSIIMGTYYQAAFNYNSTLNYWYATNGGWTSIGGTTNAGTATWAILWPVYLPNIVSWNTSSIPSTLFMVVDVSNPTGTGVVRVASTTVTAGTPPTIVDAIISGTTP